MKSRARLLTLRELSDELGISARMVRYYVKTYRIPFMRVPTSTSSMTIACDPDDLYQVVLTHQRTRGATPRASRR